MKYDPSKEKFTKGPNLNTSRYLIDTKLSPYSTPFSNLKKKLFTQIISLYFNIY